MMYNHKQVNEDLTKNSKTATNKRFTNYPPKANENYNNPIKMKQKTENRSSQIVVARPRFELGSKAPKASMLVRYIRHLI